MATHYYNIMSEKGVKVKTVSSRLPFQSEDLQSDLIIIAVKDGAIEQVCNNLQARYPMLGTQNQILVHTSGYVSTDCLKKISGNYGSFYPLQTLKKGIAVDFSSVPLCTWANNGKSALKLENIAKKLSDIHYTLDDNQRKTLHLAAVFANNFPNHLFGIAKRILDKENVPFEVLFPLMDRTVQAAKANNPFDIQTGPAFRRETSIMEQHKQRLNETEKSIYDIISESIIKESK